MQIKTIDDHEKQLAEFNELIREDFNINRYSIPLEKKKKTYSINLLKKCLLNFGI